MSEGTANVVAPQLAADDVVHDECPGWAPCHFCPGRLHNGDDVIQIICPSPDDPQRIVYAHYVCYLDVAAGRRAGCTD